MPHRGAGLPIPTKMACHEVVRCGVVPRKIESSLTGLISQLQWNSHPISCSSMFGNRCLEACETTDLKRIERTTAPQQFTKQKEARDSNNSYQNASWHPPSVKSPPDLQDAFQLKKLGKCCH
ncbi:hypothetical protein WN48_05360 [Eufriesea mexicana]|nr:hypothetical protein WN48_05360 [Eufriesea mexicana]